MPLTKFAFQPGIVKDDTPLAAEGGFINADKVRFKRGQPQTIGGWEAIPSVTVTGLARGAHQWTDNKGQKWLAWGTATKLYAFCDGVVYDITPTGVSGTLTNPFSQATGSNLVHVSHAAHGLVTGQSVTFSHITGWSPFATSSAAVTITVVDGNTYTFPAPGGVLGAEEIEDVGGHVDWSSTFTTGLVSGTGVEPARTWSLDNWGGNLVALPRGGALYEFQTEIAAPELVADGGFSTAVSSATPATGTAWGTGTNWSVTGGEAVATVGGGATNDLQQFIPTTPGIEAGKLYRVSFDVTRGATGTTTLVASAFTTTLGEGRVTVTANDHGLFKGDMVNISGAVSVNGVNPNGDWYITVVSTNTFSFESGYVATATGTGGNSTTTYSAPKVVFRVNNTSSSVGELGDASLSIQEDGTYVRYFRAPSNVTLIRFRKSRHFAGRIDNVSVKLVTTAHRVAEAPGASEAMFVDPHRIVVLLGTSLYKDLNYGLAVRWCDVENIANWTPTNSNMAGDYMLSVGSRLISGMASRGQSLLWTDTALFTMRYNGDPSSVFTFDLVGQGCGLAAPLAKAEHNGAAFWLSSGNFFTFQGGAPAPIPCPLRRDVFDNLVIAQKDKSCASALAAFNEVWWLYPDGRDGSECSRYVAFDFAENHWTCGTFARTSILPTGVFGYPIMFGTDGSAYYHEKGASANGAALSWSLDAAYADVEDGGNLMMVRRIVPDFDDQVGNVSIAVKYKRWPNAAEVTKGTFTATPTTEKIDLRLTARQVKFTLSGSSNPAFMRLGALRADVLKSGETR